MADTTFNNYKSAAAATMINKILNEMVGVWL